MVLLRATQCSEENGPLGPLNPAAPSPAYLVYTRKVGIPADGVLAPAPTERQRLQSEAVVEGHGLKPRVEAETDI